MNTENTPQISIVMPVYNVLDTLALSVASVLQQSFGNYELILVDDGSTDGSHELCQTLALQDNRIRIIHQSNKGLAGARNTGIENSRASIVAFLDSDDLWHEDKLKLHYQHLLSRPEVGVSYSASEFIDHAGQSLNLYQRPKTQDIRPQDILLRNPVGNGSVPVIRKASLDEIAFKDDNGVINYFDSALRQSEDIECWVRIATTTSWKFEGLEKALTLYRVNDSGLSANTEKQFHSWECAIGKMRSYAPTLIARHENLARANQYRYLSRRAVRSLDAKNALKNITKAIIQAPSILIRQPLRSGITLCAAIALKLLPENTYKFIEAQVITRFSKIH